MPVSDTTNFSVIFDDVCFSMDTRICISPFFVNFMALLIRLIITWRSLPGSPINFVSISGWIRHANSNPFSNARGARISTVLSMVCRTSKLMDSISNFPASILEKSRISFMSDKRLSALELTISANSYCSDVSFVSSKRFVIPITALMGVRISWLILARKSLFAFEASLAFLISSLAFNTAFSSFSLAPKSSLLADSA